MGSASRPGGRGGDRPGDTVTSFDDERTAAAVVTVLLDAGIEAWSVPDRAGEQEIFVTAGRRADALTVLSERMDQVLAASGRVADAAWEPPPPARDPDDVHAGPPLTMERIASFRTFAVVLLVPLLVVTLAPTLRGGAARTVVILIAVVTLGLLLARRRR